jgi:hypothetical protein
MGLEKVSLKKCKTILEKDGSVYTEEEVSQIRDFLYMLAELDYNVFLKNKNKASETKEKAKSQA